MHSRMDDKNMTVAVEVAVFFMLKQNESLFTIENLI